MKIGDEKFNEAVNIITNSHLTVKLSFCVPIHDSYSNVYPILIHECPPGLIKLLTDADYSVGMCAKGAYVEKI